MFKVPFLICPDDIGVRKPEPHNDNVDYWGSDHIFNKPKEIISLIDGD